MENYLLNLIGATLPNENRITGLPKNLGAG